MSSTLFATSLASLLIHLVGVTILILTCILVALAARVTARVHLQSELEWLKNLSPEALDVEQTSIPPANTEPPQSGSTAMETLPSTSGSARGATASDTCEGGHLVSDTSAGGGADRLADKNQIKL